MAHVSRLSKVSHSFFSALLMMLFAPVALAAPANPAINESGEWHLPGPGVVQNETNEPGEDIYIIRHQAPSLARYHGDIPGLAATSPSATGAKRLDVDSAASQAYLSYIAGLHTDLTSAIQAELGRPVDVVHHYNAVLNGIAVRMTAAEAQQVSTLAGIRSVTRDYERELLTDNGPKWIGADAVWGEEPPSGNAACVGNCGEGIVAGIIDTGVAFNHPSFADIGDDGYDHSNPKGLYFGACDPVTGLPFCNDKLIGYYDFTGTGPEDDNGHGSHTASTTAGNVLDITLVGNTINLERSISGVAPHANIISYKGCSGTPIGCQLSALLASINQATLDEVDVINYSIGGSSSNPWADLDAQAFFGAYEAGIFVATSAGNDGPGFATLGSPADAPWVTSVGASTHDRALANGVIDMAGGNSAAPADITGKGITSGVGPAPIVYAGDYPSAETSTPELCGAGTGDPATGEGTGGSPWTGQGNIFEGMIVVCDRGEYGRVAKGGYVQEHGAIGYILANDAASGDSLVADNHVLPGVHITHDDGNILKAWLADGASDHTGSIAGLEPGEDANAADVMASFSSRGANPAAPSVIKPDVTAPGVDILAAWMADPVVTLQDILLQDTNGEQYNIISGTSMSSPHTAGAGVLVRAAHPDWTPDEVKSALMTTAFTRMEHGNNGEEVHGVLKEDAQTPADPFDMGAGRVDMHVATGAGIVLDVGAAAYSAADPAAGGDASTLNMASLGNNDCRGTCTWTRTVRSTLPQSVSWNITSSAPAGMTITAEPAFFTLGAGQTQQIEFTADVSAVNPKGSWTFGEVRLSPSDSSVPESHFPVAVIPQGDGPPPGLTMYLHGNQHDACASGPTGTYQGDGEADVINGCIPFLSEDPLDPDNPAATWGPLQPGLNGTAVDPHWIWNLTEDKSLGGPMVVSWWASQASVIPLFDTNFVITLTVDGVDVVTQEVAHQFLTPGVPQLLQSAVDVPPVIASSSIVLEIDVIFIDTGNTVTFYYDSEQACNVATGPEGPCDSRVALPVLTEPQPPVANDDAAFLSNGETVVVDVLANDFDPEGGPLAVNIIGTEIAPGVYETANGTAEVTQSQSIRYTHDGSGAGTDMLTYEITDIDGLTDQADVNFTISAECLQAGDDYFDDFESGAPGWAVDTDTLIGPSFSWALTPAVVDFSTTTTWYTDADAQDLTQTADTSKDVRLVSPEQLVSGSTELRFWHRFSTELEFDGGVLEISTDGGNSWEDILAAGGSFVEGGYTSSLAAGSGFALSGRQAWTGISDSYPDSLEEVVVDLSIFAGQTIQVRFRFGQDVLLGQPGGGWWIDDVTFTNLFESCPPQPPVARSDSDTVTAGGMVTTDVKANDSDPDTDHVDLMVTTITVAPMHGTADIVGTDTVKYTHNGNTATMDSYEYQVEDPEGNFDRAVVTITIDHGDNQKPEANDDMGMVDAGQSVTIDVKGNDSDPDHSNDELTVTIETSPASGVAAVDGDGSITYTHNGDSATSDSFDYRLTDPLGAFDIATVDLTINQDGGGECRNDLCADDEEPVELTLTFTGGTCADSNNTQGSKSECTDHNPAGASGTVMIRATNKEDPDYGNAKVYFEGNVSEGESFTMTAAAAGEDDFGSKTFIHIYSADGTELLQTIEIHTSCSAPLVEGERFGSLKLGDADTDPSDPICSTGEGRVHGSGYWDRGTGQKHDKIDFSFDAKFYKGGYKGKLKVHDKDIDLKIDAKTITSLTTGTGVDCDGVVLDGNDTFAFTASGTFEFGDEEAVDAQFFACGKDNGKNNEPPLDNLYVECTDGCGYNTAVRIMDDSNDIAGGNIHLHDPIIDPTPEGGAASPSEVSSAGAPTSSSGNASESTSGSESTSDSSEPEGSSDVVTLEPMLVSTVPTGTPMVVTAIVEAHGSIIDGTPVTLSWTTATGLQGETTALANAYGIAVFMITVPQGDVDYTAIAGDVDSNGVRLTGF